MMASFHCRDTSPPPPKTNGDIEQPPSQGGITMEGDLEQLNADSIWSHETGSAVPFRVSLLLSILWLDLVLTYGIPPEFRGGVHLFIQTAIRHRVSPEFIGSCDCVPMAFTAESPPVVNLKLVSSKRVQPWQVTMDQLTCASLFHTDYWHQVGMLKVPAYRC